MDMTGGSERRRDRRRREQEQQRLADQQASGGFSLPELGPQSSAFAHPDPHMPADEATPGNQPAQSSADPSTSETFVYERDVRGHDSHAAGGRPRLRAHAEPAADLGVDDPHAKDNRSLVESVRAWTGANRVVPSTWADAAVSDPGAAAPGTEPSDGGDFLDKTHQRSHRLTTEETQTAAEARNPLDDTASIQQVPPAPVSGPPQSIDLRPYDDDGYFDTEPSDQLRLDLARARQELESGEPPHNPLDEAQAGGELPDEPRDSQLLASHSSDSAGDIDTDGQMIPPVAEITHAGDRGNRTKVTEAAEEAPKKRPWWFYAIWVAAACVAVVGWWKPGLGYEWFQGLSGNTVSTVSCKEAAATETVQEVATQWKHKELNVEVVPVCEGKALLSINPLTKEQAAKAEDLVKTQGRHNKTGYWMYGVPVQIRSIP